MKFLKFSVVFLAISCLFVNCSKNAGDDDDDDCEGNNTTTVIYKNTGTVPLRVQVATSLTAQFVPINPVVNEDLAPGASIEREIDARQYFTVWYNNCATSCSMVTYYSKTYVSCSENTEQQGL